MLKEAIKKATRGEDLTREEMELAMEEVMAGERNAGSDRLFADCPENERRDCG